MIFLSLNSTGECDIEADRSRSALYACVFIVMTRLDRDVTGSKINKISRSDCQY